MSHFKYYQRQRVKIIINEKTILATNNISIVHLLSKSFYTKKDITVIVSNYKDNKIKYDTLIQQFSEAKEQGFKFTLHYIFVELNDFQLINSLKADTVTAPYYEGIVRDAVKIDARLIVELDFSYSCKQIIDTFNFVSAIQGDVRLKVCKDDIDKLMELYVIYNKIKYRNGSIFNLDAIEHISNYKPNKNSLYIPTVALETLDDDVNALSLKDIDNFKVSACNTCPVNDYCKATRHHSVGFGLTKEDQCEFFKRILVKLWSK